MPEVTPLGRPGFRAILAREGRPGRGLREAENKAGKADFCRQEHRQRAKSPHALWGHRKRGTHAGSSHRPCFPSGLLPTGNATGGWGDANLDRCWPGCPTPPSPTFPGRTKCTRRECARASASPRLAGRRRILLWGLIKKPGPITGISQPWGWDGCDQVPVTVAHHGSGGQAQTIVSS